jgi:hypothetical protein
VLRPNRSDLAFTAEDAAKRYAEDDNFAEHFDRVLADLYQQQLSRLERIGRKLGVNEPAAEASAKPAAAQATTTRLMPSGIEELLRKNRSGPMTRGEIALQLGADSRDSDLTRALRMLRDAGAITQTGNRRAARYSIPKRR